MTRKRREKWFKKLLLSYIPIFIILITIIVMFFFYFFYQYSKSEVAKANSQFISYINQTVDSSLASVDQLAITLINDYRMNNFFYNTDNKDERLISYDLSREMNRILLNTQLVDSIYVYNKSTNKVLSNEGYFADSQFSDHFFISQMMDTEFARYYWSDVREYETLSRTTKETVVSLVHKIPLHSGTDGLLVLNMNIASLNELITKLFSENQSYFYIMDQQERYIAGTMNANEYEQGKETLNPLSELTSIYTNWHYESGVYGGHAVILSFFSLAWIVMLLAAIVVGVIWIIFQTRINYQPIQNMISSINAYAIDRAEQSILNQQDEFHYVQNAFQDLYKYSNEMQRRYTEGLVYKKSQCFYDLLHGTELTSNKDWRKHALLEGLQPDGKYIGIVVVEIDNYRQFEQIYNINDQGLLKYVFIKVIEEMSSIHHVPVWSEWLTSKQLGMMLQVDQEEQGQTSILALCSAICIWIRLNMSNTVTIGIGELVCQFESISESYEQALEALSHKLVIGNDRTISTTDLMQKPNHDMFYYFQTIRNVVQSIRYGERGWDDKLSKMFKDIHTALLSRNEVESLLQYLNHQLFRELEFLSLSNTVDWITGWEDKIVEVTETFHSMSMLEEELINILEEGFNKLEQLRQSSSNHAVMNLVKQYLGDNLGDPNLSQTQVADHFKLKYISQLFKEEIGEKFSDYLARQRIERAKASLLDTEDSIQDIGISVGYIHAFSFIRLFKKVVGMTPGDYRKKYSR
jgi:AraC-like DNA-binding protein